jgi:DNA-binding XRE family transcriptional regulator
MRSPDWCNSRIGKIRIQLGIIQEKLAAIFGVARITIVRWETDPANHRPHGLALVVLKQLETAIASGQAEQCVSLIRLAETDLDAALRQLYVLAQQREAA